LETNFGDAARDTLRRQFVEKLGNDWLTLAIRLGISDHERNAWPRGTEADNIWDGLVQTANIDQMVDILTSVNCPELAEDIRRELSDFRAAYGSFDSLSTVSPAQSELSSTLFPSGNAPCPGWNASENSKLASSHSGAAVLELPSCVSSGAGSGTRGTLKAFVAPQTTLECTLASIWSEVLELPQIGRDDNFFDLGGNSLTAFRIVARYKRLSIANFPVKLLFQHPTIADLAGCLEAERVLYKVCELPTQDETALLKSTDLSRLHTRTHPNGGSRSSSAPVRSNGLLETLKSIPLSFAQQSLFFLEELEGPLTVYNIADVWQLDGRLDLESLRRALEAVVERHESLRSVFGIVDGRPVQSIRPAAVFCLPVHDLRDLADTDIQAELDRRIAEEATTPFQLAVDPMLRAQILRISDTRQLLLLTMHHIAYDGLSQRILWQELKRLYESYSHGAAPELAELPCQFADFVAWQQEESHGVQFETDLSYWQKQLAGLGPLELPTDHARPQWSSYRGARQQIRLEGSLVQRLRELSRNSGTSLHITLLAAFQVLLSRYTRQTDFAIGVPIDGRANPEFESLIGMFVNTLVLRVNLDGQPSFRDVLAQVHQTSMLAYEHQVVPFMKLVERLQPERIPGCNPLIQVLFQLLDINDYESLGDVQATRQPTHSPGSPVDLELCFRPNGEGLEGELIYCVDLFNADSIERMAGHFQNLLQGIIADPDQTIDRLPLLSDAERRLVVEEWNQTSCDYPEECVHRLFEHQAARKPESVALTFDGRQMTYAELNRRANQLARCLQKIGARQESRIVIFVERSFEMIVGLLAILKAGCAYVPLDSRYPAERLAFLVQDAGAQIVLTQQHLAPRWDGIDTQLVVLDQEHARWEQESDQNLADTLTPDNLAYMIYTSGSTGIPKGVEVEHRGIVRLLYGADYVQLDETQSVLHLGALSFDVSTFEIWGGLIHGGRCVIAPPQLPDPEELRQLLRRENVRTAWFTSALFNAIVDEHVDAFQGLEQLLVGGEALSVAHIRRAQQALGAGTQFINGYGPTECTTFACCYQLPPDIPETCRSISIGRPISNTTAYILDANRQPVPVGVPGELYLGGVGVARGYLNRPELNAERFVRDPFSDRPGARMYKTGDLVRWKPDSTIEFFGRLDHQVKLRGFRIELGEIETMVARHPKVRQAVVLLREDRPGDKRLVAYIVPHAAQVAPTASELRQDLLSHLPEYMVPAVFVTLQSMPITVNGKVDKRSLPAPDSTRESGEQHYSAPRTAIEEMLASAWCQVLGLDRVGIHDNFFELGGHSLLAIRLIDLVNRQSTTNIKVADVFMNRTVAELARCIAGSSNTSVVTQCGYYLEPLRAGNGQANVVCVGVNLPGLSVALPKEIGMWWLKMDGLHVWPHLHLDAPAQAAAYVEELQSTIPTGELLLFGFSFGGLLAFEVARLLKENHGRSVELVLIEPSHRLRSRIARWKQHARTLRQKSGFGRISYIAAQLRDLGARIFKKLFKRFQNHTKVEAVPEDRWQYLEPFLISQIRTYLPQNSLNSDVHVVGRPDYFELYGAGWFPFLTGTVATYYASNQLDHLDLTQEQHSAVWVNVILKVLAESPGSSRPLRKPEAKAA
jgi:amino acid adenylation domain-containing protein